MLGALAQQCCVNTDSGQLEGRTVCTRYVKGNEGNEEGGGKTGGRREEVEGTS